MSHAAVTVKGQITIPIEVRRRLGLRQGSRVEFHVLEDRVELRVAHQPQVVSGEGFGMLKSRRPAVPVDFDPASLLSPAK